jgi:hypothetical protein
MTALAASSQFYAIKDRQCGERREARLGMDVPWS